MSWEGVAPQPKASLRKEIRSGKRKTLQVAQHMWNNGWSSLLQDHHFHWAKFLRFLKEKYYKIQAWANKDRTWKETEEELYHDAQNWKDPKEAK